MNLLTLLVFYKFSKFFPTEIHYEVVLYLLLSNFCKKKIVCLLVLVFHHFHNFSIFVKFCCPNSFMGESMLKGIKVDCFSSLKFFLLENLL